MEGENMEDLANDRRRSPSFLAVRLRILCINSKLQSNGLDFEGELLESSASSRNRSSFRD